MKQFGRQLHSQAKSVKLRSVERAELKERLQMYMEYHPLPNHDRVAAEKSRPAVAPQSTRMVLVQKWFMPFAGVTATFLILILPVVAEQAVPGDLLYPMKVQINEEVRSTLTFSSQDKIEWETTRIERRLAEARLLESQGKLTDEIELAVAAAVRQYAENTEAEIAALRVIDADEAAVAEVSFASSLAVQSEVLSRTINDRGVDAPESAMLLAVQSEEKEANARSADSTPSYERMMALIERETTTAAELFTSIKETVPAAEVERIDRRFADLEAKISTVIANHNVDEEVFATVLEVAPTSSENTAVATTEEADEEQVGIAALSVEETATGSQNETAAEATTTDTPTNESAKNKDSVAALREVLEDVKRLIRFMSDITVRESVSIDDWVPVALSSDERTFTIQSLLEELQLIAEQELPAESATEVIAEREMLQDAIATTEEFLNIGDVEQAEQEIQIALKTARSLEERLQESAGSPSAEAASSTASTSAATSSADVSDTERASS